MAWAGESEAPFARRVLASKLRVRTNRVALFILDPISDPQVIMKALKEVIHRNTFYLLFQRGKGWWM